MDRYLEAFRQQAVNLYLNTPDTIYKAIGLDLGLSRNTKQNWV